LSAARYAFLADTDDDKNDPKQATLLARNQTARHWLESLYAEEVLTLLAEGKHESARVLTSLNRLWRQTIAALSPLWEAANARHQSFIMRANAPADKTSASSQRANVDYDTAVFGAANTFRFPRLAYWHAPVLMAIAAPDFRSTLGQEVARFSEKIATVSPWFADLAKDALASQKPSGANAPAPRTGAGKPEDTARLLVLWRLRDMAGRAAHNTQARQQKKLRAEEAATTGAKTRFHKILQTLQGIPETEVAREEWHEEWRAHLGDLRIFAEDMESITSTDEDFASLSGQVMSLRRLAEPLELELEAVSARKAFLSGFMRSERMLVALGAVFVFFILFLKLMPVWMVILTALLVGGVMGYFLFWQPKQMQVRIEASAKPLLRQVRQNLAAFGGRVGQPLADTVIQAVAPMKEETLSEAEEEAMTVLVIHDKPSRQQRSSARPAA
jgi:hypothetical protein